MPDLLLELFSEEIPARFQKRAAEDLKKGVTDALVEAGLVYEGAVAFVTPRRLALRVTGVPARSPDTREERKGPRVGAPQSAIDGFLRAAGLSSIEDATIQKDGKKGEVYVASVEKPGAEAGTVLAEILPRVISGFSWPKSMRWGSGSLTWVRPLRAITATFGAENDEVAVVPFAVDGLRSGQTTFGHRFMAPDPIQVKRFDDYADALERAKVVLDFGRRRDTIRTDAEHLAFAQGLELVADAGLFDEVAGLVEWPVVMMGGFSEDFLALPEEVIVATIKANQKCFCLRDRASGKLANRFILTANIEAEDGGTAIVAGNERVIRARLSDAMFFYRNDLVVPLESQVPKLGDMVFHQKLGNQLERVERLVALAGEIAPMVGADVLLAKLAARLAKADLVSEMVGEFPELQGLMGKYYARSQGESPEVANAIEQHYKPLGPADKVPNEPVSVALALADKLDLLAGFWVIGEKPTGSRDPFALRRAALGVIRLIVENGLRLRLGDLFELSFFSHSVYAVARAQGVSIGGSQALSDLGDGSSFVERLARGIGLADPARDAAIEVCDKYFFPLKPDLLAFFHDRLKVTLREAGARHDLVDAVITSDSDDILQIVQRVEALSALITSELGQSLLAGYRRSVNILAIEEKKDGKSYGGDLAIGDLQSGEELALAEAVLTAQANVSTHVTDDDYSGALQALSSLREPVDAFFEAVLVNDPDPTARANRLTLLARLRDTMHLVADFGKVAGGSVV